MIKYIKNIFIRKTLEPIPNSKISASNTHFSPPLKGCDRYTNSPCSWSNTPISEDRCRKCNIQFPGW